MPEIDRTRIDYMPGDAALDALTMTAEMFPALRTLALIDRLVIVAVAAMQHADQHKPCKPPSMWGNDRHRWKLPDSLMQGKQ